MDKILYLIGLILIVVSLRFFYLFKVKQHVYKNAKDGSKNFYIKRKRDAKKCLIIGLVTIFVAFVCLVSAILGNLLMNK